MFPNVGPRISQLVPEAKIVYLVRNPLERAEAGYLQLIDETPKGAEKASINGVVKQIRHLVGSSMYFSHWTYYKKYFPPERMLVSFSEDFRAKPGEEFGRILKFIGVPKERAMEVEERRIVRELKAEAEGESEQRNRHPISWEAKVKEAVLETLNVDAEKLLQACGKPKDFWKMA
jgi:hypothetical protein